MSKEKKSWYKRWWAIVLFIFIGLWIIGSLLPSEAPEAPSSAEEVAKEEPPIPKEFEIGEDITAGDFKWKITGFSKKKEIGEYFADTFLGEKADGVFIIMDVEVENTGKSAQYLTDAFVKLVDGQGREFSANTVAAIYLKPQGSALVFETINPGIVKKGKIVFDVPEGLEVVDVRISDSLLKQTFYSVKLTT
jgi:hypothetical protein